MACKMGVDVVLIYREVLEGVIEIVVTPKCNATLRIQLKVGFNKFNIHWRYLNE